MPDTQVKDVANKVPGYVIAGGGTTGLTLAARLTEDPSVSVAVIEAGYANIDDPNIIILGQFGKTLGDTKSFFWSRGKGLGGSSCVNFYVWVKPSASDIDAIEKLGNPGWGWESYAKYSRKGETFHEPSAEQPSTYPHTFSPKDRGHSGPIQVSIPHMVHTIDEPFQKTMVNMGLNAIDDHNGGDITGTWIGSANLDPQTYGRSYAANAYYLPNKNRPNLTIVTEAAVVKVLFADRTSPNDTLIATGLEVKSAVDPSRVYVVHARKEVILSTGAIKSPQILELSGIGRKEILHGLGIDVKIELPGVGENVQEHMHFVPIVRGCVALVSRLLHICRFLFANPEEYSSLIAKASQEIKNQKASGKLPPGLAEQLDLQLQLLKDNSTPDIEIAASPLFSTALSAPEPGKMYVTLSSLLCHPLSRGTIHAVSKDPMQPPEIDPHYFENDFDLEMLVQHVKFIRKVSQVEPWKSTVVREVDPGPNYTTDEEIREYIKNAHGTSWHTIGSCSMLPRDKQGVVDPELKVYGTQNLRIVDLSIIPLHVAAYTQTTAYVVGEKAADIIRGI